MTASPPLLFSPSPPLLLSPSPPLPTRPFTPNAIVILSIADNFIKRPVLTTVCTLMILLVGGIAIPLLPIEQLPELAPTRINVNSNYTGADAATVENTVTTILEREINGVEGMDYITSNSSNDGSSSISVVFQPGQDKDIAQVNVQNNVSVAEPQLPDAVKQTGVRVKAASSSTLLVYSFFSENDEYDELFLTNYVDLFILDEIKRITGVGDVTLYGAGKYAMRLWLDPSALASRGLTAVDVTGAIREQNIQVAAGGVGQQPAPADQAYEFTVRVPGRLQSAEEFENLVLKVDDDGTLVRLKDVGRAELGQETYAASVSTFGKAGVGIGVNQLPGSNAMDVATAIKARMAELEENFPPGLTAELIFDTTDFVKASLKEVLVTLVQAISLVIAILFVFLQDWRTTIIPAVAIPVALIGAMAFLLMFGFSINTLTLFGCILASGLVVDDAIVVVEAVSAKIDAGMRPKAAAIACMQELSGAVVSTSLVLMAVFIPVAFFPGTTGKIYQQFALTIAFTVLCSTFNALSFSPSMSALLLRPRQETRGWLGKVFNGFNVGLHWTTEKYRDAVNGLVRVRVFVMGLFVAALVATVWMYQVVPTGFVPEEDQGYFLGIVQAPDGVSLNYTKEVLEKAENVLLETPEIRGTFMVSGVGFDGRGSNQGLFFGSFKDWSERTGKGQAADELIAKLNGQFAQIQEAVVRAFNAPPVQGLSTFGGFEFQLQDRSGGQLTYEDLLSNTYDVIGAANEKPEIGGSAFTQATANTPQVQLTVDRDRLKAANVSFSDAMTTLGIYLGSQYVNDFTLGQRSYRVYAQAEGQFRSRTENIDEIYVRSRDGNMVPLGELVKSEPITGPQIISHFNLFRAIKIQGANAPGYSSGQALQAMEAAYKEAALPSTGREWMGTAREELTAGGQAVIIFGLGIVIVFLVLSAQYESYIDPIIILLTVPLAMLGALVFLFARGLNLDVYAQVGLVMLIGLASKNAILIVEFANQSRAEGMSIAKAAVNAAEQRFRPILMTAISSLVGFFPLVIASGAGSASRWSLGTAVFGGLLVATFLSFLVVPILYIVVKSFEARFLLADGETPTAAPPPTPPTPMQTVPPIPDGEPSVPSPSIDTEIEPKMETERETEAEPRSPQVQSPPPRRGNGNGKHLVVDGDENAVESSPPSSEASGEVEGEAETPPSKT
ncbi:efflux RND transporter permease subunit [Geitlerinema sp. CS-897]|nr:efflux RND transporter permease subunit [Geitlerinema sp. CS-897]